MSEIGEERLDWLERWAKGWQEILSARPPNRYYAELPLEVATDAMLELIEALR